MQLQFISLIHTLNCKFKCISTLWDKNLIKDNVCCKGNVNCCSDWNNGLQEVPDTDPLTILIISFVT